MRRRAGTNCACPPCRLPILLPSEQYQILTRQTSFRFPLQAVPPAFHHHSCNCSCSVITGLFRISISSLQETATCKHRKAGNQRICKRPEGKLFDIAVNQYNSNTAEDASINGKPALIDLKDGEKVILVLLPLKKHIVCSGTENTHGNQSKHEII